MAIDNANKKILHPDPNPIFGLQIDKKDKNLWQNLSFLDKNGFIMYILGSLKSID